MATWRAQPTWREPKHAIQVRSGTHVTIHGCTFVNLSGDGVLVYEGSTSVRMHHCTFRGQNTNRNGISITNAQVCRTTDCTFVGMTPRAGPIDLEPDVADERVTDVLIARNKLVGTGQPVQAAITVFNAIANATIANITIEQNQLRTAFSEPSGSSVLVLAASRTSSSGTTPSGTSPTPEPIQLQDAHAAVSVNLVEPPSVVPEDVTDTEPQRRRR